MKTEPSQPQQLGPVGGREAGTVADAGSQDSAAIAGNENAVAAPQPVVPPRKPDKQYRRERGPGAPEANGGRLMPPWQKGTSGNPAGGRSLKPITDAYHKLGLEMGPAELASYKPANAVEAGIKRALLSIYRVGATTKVSEAVHLLREMADRLEGSTTPPSVVNVAVATMEDAVIQIGEERRKLQAEAAALQTSGEEN